MSRSARRRLRHRAGRILAYLTLMVIAIVGVAPFLYLLILSTKRRIDIVSEVPPRISFAWDVTKANYTEVLQAQGLKVAIGVSVVVVGVATVISLVIGTPAGYALSRLAFRRREQTANTILSMRFMPPIAVAIPLFLMIKGIGLQDTLMGLILPYVSFELPLIVWITMGFFDEIPREIDEAALIDGCSKVTVLWRVLLPLVRPGVLTAGLFGAIFVWNEFLVALYVVDSREHQTISLAAATLVSAQRPIDWNIAAAVGVVTVIPILLASLLVQKYITRGLTAGAIK